jgi:general stress protein 26
MSEHEVDTTKVWDLAEKISFCMLTTQTGSELRARPMSAYVERLENAFYFLTDVASHKDDEIAERPHVCLAFADSKGQKYVSVSGTAEVPSIRVLKVTPTSAEYWDSPGSVISYIKMAAAAVSSTRPDMGDNGKVEM